MNKKPAVFVTIAIATCLLLGVSAYFVSQSRSSDGGEPSVKTSTGTEARPESAETAEKTAYDEAVAS